MAETKFQPDWQLVKAVCAGDPAATQRFLAVVEGAVFPLLRAFLQDQTRAEEHYLVVLDALKSNSWEQLARYDGRSSLATFLKLIVRDVLAGDVARAFALEADPNRAWRGFEQLFGPAIHAQIRRRFPRADESRRADLYQEVALQFAEQGWRRLRAWQGHGNFGAFVMTVVNRLLLDLLRRESSRRRFPTSVARLSALHQAVFAAVIWQSIPQRPDILEPVLRGRVKPPPTEAEIAAALDQLSSDIAQAQAGALKHVEISLDDAEGATDQLSDPGISAEDRLLALEEEQHTELVLNIIRSRLADLPDRDKLYLSMVWDGVETTAPREIARRMGLPVETVYELRKRTRKWMRDLAEGLDKNNSAHPPKNALRPSEP